MTDLRTAAQQALEALEIGWSPKYVNGVDAREKGMKAITALRAALEDGDNMSPIEPVAWQWLNTAHFRKKIPAHATPAHWRPLYAAPPQRKPLSDDEITQAMFRADAIFTGPMQFRFAREIERTHGIKP